MSQLTMTNTSNDEEISREWKKGENSEQHYWVYEEYDIIQIKADMKQIFMVKWIDGRGEKGTPAYQGHYKTIEDAKNFQNGSSTDHDR